MLSIGWYRFSGAAGNQMAESCVDRYRCDTYYPGWLNGSHPTVNEAAVQRRVCFGFHGHCCIYSTYIRVRNCGDFYVYQLKPLTVWYSTLLWQRICIIDTNVARYTFSFFFFFFFFSSWKERIRHLSMKQITETLYLHMMKMNAIFSSALPPLLPTNKPSNERINQTALNDNCMVEILVFSPEDSKWA